MPPLPAAPGATTTEEAAPEAAKEEEKEEEKEESEDEGKPEVLHTMITAISNIQQALVVSSTRYGACKRLIRLTIVAKHVHAITTESIDYDIVAMTRDARLPHPNCLFSQVNRQMRLLTVLSGKRDLSLSQLKATIMMIIF